MGWSNYVIIPEWKMMFEVSKYIDEEAEYPTLTGEPLCDTHKPIKDVTLSDIGDLIYYSKKVPYIEYKDELLIMWLNYREIEHIIISENDERLKQYKNYKVVHKK